MIQIGVVTYMLLSGHEPFLGSDDQELVMANKIVLYEFAPEECWATISESAKDFIRVCLQKTAQARITPSAAKQHPWLKNLPVL